MKRHRLSWYAAATAALALLAVLVVRRFDGPASNLAPHSANADAASKGVELEADDAASLRSPSAPLTTATIGLNTDDVSTARVVLLSKTTRAAPADSMWVLTRVDRRDAARRRSLDAAGGIELSPGTWTVESTDPRWHVETGEVRVSPGDTAVIWVGERSSFEVRVVDELRAPVADAAVRWLAAVGDPHFDPDWDWWRRTFPPPVRTDGNGLARLIDVAGPQGNLAIVKDGYAGHLANVRVAGIARLEVSLQRARGDIQLSVKDSITAEAIEGATLLTRYGPCESTSSASGTLIVPSWAAAEAYVRVSAAGYCTANCSIGAADSREVTLTKSCTLQVVASGIAPAAEYQASIERLDSPVIGLTLANFPQQIEGAGAMPVHFAVPCGSTLRFHGVSSDGLYCEAYVEVGASQQQVDLRFASAATLNIRTTATRSSRALARYVDRRELAIESDASQVLRIPAPDRLLDIRIETPGFATSSLRPSSVSTSSKTGELSITSTPSVRCHFKLRDLRGEPLPGMSVRLAGDADNRAVMLYPELGGCVPTSHPGWWMAAEPDVELHADSRGECSAVGLIDGGTYRASVDLPAAIFGESGTLSDLGYPQFRFHAAEGAEFEWKLPRARRVAIHAYDAQDGTRVGALLIGNPDRHVGMLFEESGADRELWIPESVDQLRVLATGFEPAWIEIPASEEENVHREVFLRRQGAGRLILDGAVEGFVGKRVRVSARRPAGDATLDLRAGQLLWQGTLVVRDPNGTPLFVPVDTGADLLIEPFAPHERWVARSTGARWSPGAELRFVVSVPPSDR